MHREPILSSLAAGPTSQQSSEAGPRSTENDDSSLAKRGSTRQRKLAHSPDSEARASPSASVAVTDEDSADHRKQSHSGETKRRTSGTTTFDDSA